MYPLNINIFVFFIFAQDLAQRGTFNMYFLNLNLEDLTLFLSLIPGIGEQQALPGGVSGPIPETT